LALSYKYADDVAGLVSDYRELLKKLPGRSSLDSSIDAWAKIKAAVLVY